LTKCCLSAEAGRDNAHGHDVVTGRGSGRPLAAPIHQSEQTPRLLVTVEDEIGYIGNYVWIEYVTHFLRHAVETQTLTRPALAANYLPGATALPGKGDRRI
jgi:hypothetical protein